MYEIIVPSAQIRLPNPDHRAKKQQPDVYIGLAPDGLTMNTKTLPWDKAVPILMQLLFPDGDLPDMYRVWREQQGFDKSGG